MDVTGMLTEQEIALARHCLDHAAACGASKCRISLNKSLMELTATLDGEVDKVTHALDRSLTLNLLVDGRFGTFSTNRLEKEGLERFTQAAIATVRMLSPDPCRDLPQKSKKVTGAAGGMELDLFDPDYPSLGLEERRAMALGSSLWKDRDSLSHGFTILSEEGEYSDSVYDNVVLDSEGLYCRHTETSFEIGHEITVADPEGNRFSGYWWDASPRLSGIAGSLRTCSRKALERAAEQISPRPFKGGKVNVVVDAECASKLLNPVLAALGGYAVQQKNSFLEGKLGKKVFGPGFTVVDLPHEKGMTGSRLFDSEGAATAEGPIIENGTVRKYFINTYIANKLGIGATNEDCTRPKVMPYGEATTMEQVLALVGNGIYITGFNGGNSNSSTGDFSYGIEGFAIEGGRITHPVREMLMTGNFVTLWRNLVSALDDARPCMSRLVPTLAFVNVDING